MYAGAKRVVASLWKVDDEATGELMRVFYREMLEKGGLPAMPYGRPSSRFGVGGAGASRFTGRLSSCRGSQPDRLSSRPPGLNSEALE